MPFLIGTDEAGYGPNLGPLVISASLWWVAEPTDGTDLYKRLKRVVCKVPPRDPRARLGIADSKELYNPAAGLHALERGVLGALGLLGECPQDWFEIWQALDERSAGYLPTMPWHVDYDLRLPVVVDPEDLVRLIGRARRGFEASGVRLLAVRSRAVFPDEFNRSNDALGNKSETLSKTTLALVADVLASCSGEPVLVVCDKHGGRNRYGRLLQEQFPDTLVAIYQEGAACSVYRLGDGDARIEFCFRTKGEQFMPAALASMASKYLRELAMRAFNEFWCTRVADLAPTAGYPGDARRFRAAIQPTQTALGIADQILWRER